MSKIKIPLIMISGKGGSGKNTFCDMMTRVWDNSESQCIDCYELALANKVKKILSDLFMIDSKDMRKRSFKNDKTKLYNPCTGEPLNGRQLMQVFATEVCRSMNPYIWCDHWLSKVVGTIDSGYGSSPDIFIIPDFRFVNEYEFMNFYFEKIITIRINKSDSSQDMHSSECELDDGFQNYTYIVDNYRDIKHLEARAKSIAIDIAKGLQCD